MTAKTLIERLQNSPCSPALTAAVIIELERQAKEIEALQDYIKLWRMERTLAEEIDAAIAQQKGKTP